MSVPYLTPAGSLSIPFDSDRRYHWWAGGQPILATLRELNAPAAVLTAHSPENGRESGMRVGGDV